MDRELENRLNEIRNLAQRAADNAESARAEAAHKGHFFVYVLLIAIAVATKAC